MSAFLLAFAFVMQSAATPPQQQPRLQPQPGPPQAPSMISPAHDLYYEEANRFASRATPEARRVLHEFAGCVARHSRGRAEDTLRRDFTTPRYRSALIQLARSNDTCQDNSEGFRAGGLPFAGALAEHLLAGDPTPLNVRLARAAAQPAVRHYSATDRMALCVVRSVPDEVARLFATELGSDDETRVIGALNVPVQACAQGGSRLEVTPAGLRAMFATASFRTVANQAAEVTN
jgi:hypothetical protein